MNFDKLQNIKLEDLKHYNFLQLVKIKEEVIKKINLNSYLINLYDKSIAVPFFNLNTEFNNALKVVNKSINKFNNYRSVKVDVLSSDYESRTRQIIFSNKFNNKNIIKWLEKHNYKLGYTVFNIYNDYDCTGNICSIDVELKNNVCTITEYFDV